MCTLWPQPYDRQLSKLEVCIVLSRRKAEKQSVREWTVLLLRVKGCRHHRGAPHRYSNLHSPRPHHELCVSLSQLPPPNAVVWASQPTKDVFIALTWKKIFSLLYRSMKELAPDKAKLKQIKDINTESNPKIFCNQTGIQTFTLAVVVFRGWSMGLSGLKSSRGSWRREGKRESEMIDRWWKIEGWQGWDLELVHITAQYQMEEKIYLYTSWTNCQIL